MDILKLAGTYEFIFTTHDPSTAELTDVDGDTFTTSTYENAVDGSMYSPVISQVQDDHAVDVTGTYRCVVVATGANGFETGKRYNVVTTYDIGGTTQSSPVATFKLLTYDLDDIMAMIGTAIALDGGGATIAGMLTKIADDNGGADFNAGTDSLHEQTHQIVTIDGNVDDIETAIGTPVALDGGSADLAGMLTKIADDNGGADFDAGTDSLHEISDTIATIDPSGIADAVWNEASADHVGAGSTGLVLSYIGTPVALDGGDVTLAGMLTKIADDNGGADFDAGTDSLHELSDVIATISAGAIADAVWDETMADHLGVGSTGEQLAAVGTPVVLDGHLGSIAGMLTAMADDNNGADFNSEFDSLNKISDALDVVDGNVDDVETLLGTVDGKVDTISGNVDDIETAIGTPVALDGGAATLGGMLTKIADDNGGADFDAGTDSLHEQTLQIATIDGNVDDIETAIGTPVALDGGAATLGGMLTKIADDNGGADFNAGTDSLKVLSDMLDTIDGQTSQLTFTGSAVQADMTYISGDSGAADNLELQFDGTGLTGATYPSRQDQLNNIVLTGSAVNVPASSFTMTTGSEVGGTTYTNTFARDGVYHQLTDNAGTLDCYYEYQITADGVPTSITLAMAVTGNNDDIKVYGYDWVAPGWVQLGTVVGVTGLLIVDRTFPMFTTMVGTGADSGKVRIRLYNTGLTSSNTYVDLGFCSYSVVNRSVGYSQGRIWIDTINGTAGTTPYVDGTADHPVDSWADALTLAAALNVYQFNLAGGTSIQLTANSDYYAFYGPEASIDLNGQSIAAAYFDGPYVFGVGTGDYARFIDCRIGDVTLDQPGFGRCAMSGTVTAGNAGVMLMEGCFSANTGASAPQIDFGAAIGDLRVNIRHHSGRVEILNMGQAGNDYMTYEGMGRLIFNVNCMGGSVKIRGLVDVEDNSGGAVTISEEDARVDYDQISSAAWDPAMGDHLVVGSTGEQLSFIGTPVVLDGGAATVGGMLTAMADNNGGADFSSATDSLHAIGAAVSGSADYEDGVIWVDTINGVAGAVPYVNGLDDNPVDNWADALILSGLLNIRRFRLITGSSISLSANSDYYTILGDNSTVILGAQSIVGIYIEGCTVRGTGTGDGFVFRDCDLGTLSIGAGTLINCAMPAGTITLGTGTCLLDGCYQSDVTQPTLDYGAIVANTTVMMMHYSGSVEIQNMGAAGVDYLIIDGEGELNINANCAGGTVVIRGVFDVTDGSAGAVTITEEARLDYTQVENAVWDATLGAHIAAGSTGEQLSQIGYAISLDGSADQTVVGMLTKMADDNAGADFDATTDSLHAIAASIAGIASSGGYEDGYIWVDTSNGTAGAVPYTNGVATLPVDNWADALTLSGLLSIQRFYLVRGTSITLSGASRFYTIVGDDATVDLNTQNITGAYFDGITINGNATGLGATFKDCKMTGNGLWESKFIHCHLTGTMNLYDNGTGVYIFDDCYNVSISPPVLDYGVAEVDVTVDMHHYSGALSISNMGQAGTDILTIEGDGYLIFGADCIGGLRRVNGIFTINDGSTGMTIFEEGRIDYDQISSATWDPALAGHVTAGTTGEQLSLIGTPVALDGGTATVAGMLTKMADDNGGADFDASEDSLHEISIETDASAIADAVWDEASADHELWYTMGGLLKYLKDHLNDPTDGGTPRKLKFTRG